MSIKVSESWGKYGSESPCEHLIALRNLLESTGMTVWSEHGESPSGWVNVSCESCRRTYETTLRPRYRGMSPEIWSDDDADEESV